VHVGLFGCDFEDARETEEVECGAACLEDEAVGRYEEG